MIRIKVVKSFNDLASVCDSFGRVQISFAHDYMQDFLTEEHKNTMWVNIRDKAMLPGLELYTNGPYAPLAYMKNNWGITTNSGLIAGALEFYEYDPQLAKKLIGYALRKLTNFFHFRNRRSIQPLH